MALTRAFCRLAIGLVFALGAPVLYGRAWAETKIYEVRDVPVDATAAGATEARDQAFAQGQEQALAILLKRLTLKSDWGRLPSAAGQDYKRLIAGFAVGSEKRSSTRYIAKVTYDFVPERVRSILRNSGISFSETRAKPMLVLPVLQTADGRLLLWEPENVWAAAWRQKPMAQELVPMLVPAGEPADQAAARGLSLQSPNWAQIQPLATPLGAAHALIPILTLRRAGDHLQADARIIEVKPGNVSESHVSAQGADENAAIANAIDAISESVTQSWKQATAVGDGAQASLVADASYPDLNGWLQIRRGLLSAPSVKSLRIIALSADGAELEIGYVGTSDQLAIGLAQQDLVLSNGDDGHFTLASRVVPAAPAPAAAAPSPTPAMTTPPPAAGAH